MHHSILVCDGAHIPHHWASWQDGITLKYKHLLSHEMGDPSVFRGGVSKRTGERSQLDVAPIIFLKEVLRYDSRIPPLTNQNLFARDLHICGWCGRHYPEPKLSRDHIIPVSRGGLNIWMNVVTSCKTCNHDKANNFHRDIGMELVYLPYIPSHIERLILQNRKIIFDQMEYLKAMLPEHSRILKAEGILGIN